MRVLAFCLLGLLAIGCAQGSFLDLTETACATNADVTLDLRGSGSGESSVTAYCKAEADAQLVFEEKIGAYFEKVEDNPKNACVEAEAKEVVEGVAEAIANAYTSVSTKVDIEGTGEACAAGYATGDALAISLVDLVIELSVRFIEEKYEGQGYGKDVVDKLKEKENNATGSAKGHAIAVGLAKAWAQAYDEACTTGKFKEDWEESSFEATTKIVAEIWATIVIELCSKFDEVDKDDLKEWQERSAKAFAELKGEISVEGEVDFEGDASGVAEEVVPCESLFYCCDTYGKSSCDCGDSSCDWVLFSTVAYTGTTIWAQPKEDIYCFC